LRSHGVKDGSGAGSAARPMAAASRKRIAGRLRRRRGMRSDGLCLTPRICRAPIPQTGAAVKIQRGPGRNRGRAAGGSWGLSPRALSRRKTLNFCSLRGRLRKEGRAVSQPGQLQKSNTPVTIRGCG
jgi:hypothetical protein